MLWLTYIYKARGKPEIDDCKENGQTFSSSRPNREQDVPTEEAAVLNSVLDEEDDTLSTELIGPAHFSEWAIRRASPYAAAPR